MKTTPKKQGNKPLIAECYLCGYRTPVSGFDDPIMSQFCPNCGGAFFESDGSITYLPSMDIVDDSCMDAELFQ